MAAVQMEEQAVEVVSESLGETREQDAKHVPVATRRDERADESYFRRLRFMQARRVLRRKTQPGVLVEFERSPPIQTEFIADSARIGGKEELLSGGDPGDLRIVILEVKEKRRHRRMRSGRHCSWLNTR